MGPKALLGLYIYNYMHAQVELNKGIISFHLRTTHTHKRICCTAVYVGRRFVIYIYRKTRQTDPSSE